MKNIKLIVILTLVLFGLGGLATWDEWKTKEEEKETKTKNRLTTITPDQVSEFVYTAKPEEVEAATNGDVLEVKLAKVDGVWMINHPISIAADGPAVDNLLKAVTDYMYASVVSTDKATWKNFGLDSPKVKLLLKTTKGTEETLIFGTKAPVGYNSYLATSASDNVLMGSQHIAVAVSKTLFDLRSKSMVKIDELQIKSLEYKSLGRADVTLIKDGNNYKFAHSDAEPDVAYIRDFIDDINFVKADKFIDNPDPVLAGKFSDPEISMKITFDGKPDLILSFLSSADKMYGRVGASQSLVELPAEFAKIILKSNNDFRNRRIVPSAFMSSLTTVTIDGVFYKKITGSWFAGEEIGKAEGPEGPSKAKESAHVRPFVVDLEFAKTEDFYKADQPDYANSLLQAPIHTVILEGKDEPKKIAVDLYKHELLPDKYWVKVTGSSSGFLVPKSHFESITPSTKPASNAPISPEG
jgi:hypothetical protein